MNSLDLLLLGIEGFFVFASQDLLAFFVKFHRGAILVIGAEDVDRGGDWQGLLQADADPFHGVL